MVISASLVKELREKTGVGLMECKKALQESNGDIEASITLLREKGISKAAKKADRSTNEGKIFIAVSPDNKKAAIIELSCETDFVAGNDDFSLLGNLIAQSALNSDAKNETEIESISSNGKLIQTIISDYVLKLGENIQLRKLTKVDATETIANYIHMNGKIGVVIAFSKPVTAEVGSDIAMHIAATAPQYVYSTEIPEEEIEKERSIIRAQAKNEGRPDDVVEKIISGKVTKFFKDVCLVEQSFIKDDKLTIKQLLPTPTSVESFIRYSL